MGEGLPIRFIKCLWIGEGFPLGPLCINYLDLHDPFLFGFYKVIVSLMQLQGGPT